MAQKIKKRKSRGTAMLSWRARMKSTMDVTKASMLPAYRVYAGFCRETTLHGMKHSVEPRVHCCERFLWFVLTLSAFFGAVYCALSQWSRYDSEPVVVSMQRDYRRWWSAFPAITACFSDRIDPERAHEIIAINWNVTEESDPEKYEYYYGFLDLVVDVSFRTNLQHFWKYQDDDTVKDIDLQELALSVHPTNMLRVLVSDAVGENMYWTPVMTEVGMCVSFNSLYARFQHMQEDELFRQQPLQMFHYLSGQCYIRVDSLRKAVRYFIHSPYEISTAISNPTGEVLPGEELVIDFKEVEILASDGLRSLRPDQRRCRYSDEWISDSIRAYSFGLCQMHCRNRMALMFCGCRPYFYVRGDGEPCDAHGMACVGRNVEILINLPRNLAKCSCLPQCAEHNFYSHTKKVVNRSSSAAHPFHPLVGPPLRIMYLTILLLINMNDTESEEDDSQMSALRINMMPPKFRLKRDVIFTLEDLFASLGGTTALFVGASVLTVVETMLFIIRHFIRAVVLRRPITPDTIVDFKP